MAAMTVRRLMADRPWILVGLVTIVGATLRLTDLGRFSFWIDELITVCSADSIHDVATFFTPACGNMHPPLDFLLVKWWSLGGRDEVWLRMLPALFGVAAIPVVYQLGREVAGHAVGLIAAALAACSPFLVPYDRELRMYSLLMLLSTASMLFFVRALRRGRHPDWAAFAVISSLNLYVHYHATLVLTGQTILGLFWPQPFFVADDLNLFAHRLRNQLRGLADRDLEVTATVDHFAFASVGAKGGEEERHRIRHVVEVSSWADTAQPDPPLATRNLRDDGGNDSARRRARPIRVERPGNHDRHAE